MKPLKHIAGVLAEDTAAMFATILVDVIYR
jgi:hypothetical protein